MSASTIGAIIVGALFEGSLYALLGVGFVILRESTRVFNFAQGSFMVLGGYFYYTMTVNANLPWPLAVIISLAAMTLIGVATYVIAFRKLFQVDVFVLVIATLGLSIILEVITQLIWGPNIRTLPSSISSSQSFRIGIFRFAGTDLYALGSAVLIIVLLALFLQRTRTGLSMRATADDPVLAAAVQLNVYRSSAIAWAIAGLCAGAAGISYTMARSLDPLGLQDFGLVAFAAILLGGLNSIVGALVGGLLLAVLQSTVAATAGGQWTDVAAYIVLLVVLLVRPQGLFGVLSPRRL